MQVLLDAFPDAAKIKNDVGRDFMSMVKSEYERLCRDIADPSFCGDGPDGTARKIKMRDEWQKPQALIDYEMWHAKHGVSARRTFEAASVVHVLSTRYTGASFAMARYVKATVEAAHEGVACFNPNEDNLLFEDGRGETANAAWLKRWRNMLVSAKKTGGVVLQVLSEDEGLSDMQDAEVDMAGDKDVRVVQLRFRGNEDSDLSEVQGKVREQLESAGLNNAVLQM